MALRFLKKQTNAHLAFWGAFVSYEMAVVFSVNGKLSPLLEYIIYYALNISFFYLHAALVVTTMQGTGNRYWRIGIGVLGEIVGYLLVKKLIIYLLFVTGFYQSYLDETLEVYVRNSVWRAVYFIGLGTAYAFVKLTIMSRKHIANLDRQKLDSQLQKQQLQQSLLVAENAYLKAQINPHFIFNTLGFLANQVAAFSESSEALLINFADVIRYAITAPDKDGKVSLEAEIEHIENYLKINAERFSGRHHVHFCVKGQAENLKVLPLIFMTLIENVYKYGELSDAANPAIIDLVMNGRTVNFVIRNKKAFRSHYTSHGIGMKNVKGRLEAFYPKNYVLDIHENENFYFLKLSLDL